MSASKVNTKSVLKIHNPKAHAPAVYIPCWLIQIPSSQLSHQAKLLYGRLAQWSSAKGTVHRTLQQLTEEIGASVSTIKRTLKELKDVGLIGTYQVESGGINHYHFYDHAWMHAPINKNLEYQSPPIPHATSDVTPQPRCGLPPSPDVTLPQPRCGLPKIKEIKRNKITTTTLAREKTKKSSSSGFVISKEIDGLLLTLRAHHIPNDTRGDHEFLRQCSHHLDNGNKEKYNLTRRVKGLQTIIQSGFFEKPAGYDEKKVVKSQHTPEQNALLATYEHALRMQKAGMKIEVFFPDSKELKKAIELKEHSEKHKSSLSKRFGSMIGFNSI